MGTAAVLLQAGLTVGALGVFVLVGWLTDASLSGDPRLAKPGHPAAARDGDMEGGEMGLESELVRQLMADRMKEATSYRRGAQSRRRTRGTLRRRVGYGLVRTGFRLLGTPAPRLTREGARP